MSRDYELRVIEDVIASPAVCAMDAAHRVIYLVEPRIRMLLRGTFRVETAGHTLHREPGQPWFETGPDPVYAVASPTHDTAFIRVMILPEKLQGKSSIRYVNPEDQAKPKSQRYTIFVDAPIAL
ncbi:MAG: hypothetical protein DMD81_03710 [Candidatus Rokuibacteriota bacterium]|nr:MAG: hypothetical protein DMD81_03710 [Candidatus Rokubacteria bacterium]